MNKIDAAYGIIVLGPDMFPDDRGYFYESFNAEQFKEITGWGGPFVQENQSYSIHNVLRGLHYQVEKPQGKLVQCIQGTIFDVAVDVRRTSITYGGWSGVMLSDLNRHQVWIPPGYAHGFLVLSPGATVSYKVTQYWAPEHERCIRWDDPTLQITWPLPLQMPPILSIKDKEGVTFQGAESYV